MTACRPTQPVALGALAALLAVGAAVAGLADPTLYRPLTPPAAMPGTASQDLVSILTGLAVLAISPRLRRGPSRLWSLWLGLLGYLLYAYALYSFERLYNPLFLVYVAILGLSLWALVLAFLVGPPLAMAPSDRERPPPRRLAAAYLCAIAAMFLAIWLRILLPAMASRSPPPGSAIFV